MADIELVIKIPEEIYRARQHWVANQKRMIDKVDIAIANGTPLPKGHGRLIDADALYEQYAYADYNFDMTMEYAPTIIEADKEYEVKVITRGNCMICGKELTEGLFICQECGEKSNKESEE